MANTRKRISQLTALTSASLNTTLVGVDGGTTYKIELDTLADAVTSRVNILDRSRLSSLESVTSSFETKGRSVISSSAQITNLGFVSSSVDISALNSFTSSQEVRNTAFTNGISARLQTSSFNDFSSSVHQRILDATNEQSFNGLVSGSSQLTSSYDERYVLSGSITQTTWDNIANKPAGIVSQSTDLSSLNTFTASISTASLVNRLNVIESVSGSWITESETGSFLTNLNGAISSSEQVFDGSGVYSSSAQIQGNIYSAGSSFTFQDLLIGAGTTFGKITTDGSKYISVMPTYNVESARFWTNGNVTIQDGGDYVDNGFRLEVSGSTKIVGSFNATDGITGSTNFNTIVNKPTLISGSSQLTSSFDTRYTLSGSVVSGTTPAGTISGSSQLTSSFDSRYVLETETGSLQTSITSLNTLTSSLATTGSNSFNGNQTITGSLNITSGNIIASAITANTSSLYLTSGSNLYVQNNGIVEITGSMTVSGVTRFNSSVTIGPGTGNEGGELSLSYPITGSLVGSAVAVDVYQDRVRIFEGGGTSRGVYIDLSKAPAGVGGELLWKASGLVNADVDVTLGNLKARIPSTGNRSLQLSTVSGTYSVYGSGVYSFSGISGTTIASGSPLSITTTPAYIIPSYNFTVAGAVDTWTLMDTSAGIAWRITMIIGASYNNNMISIERLV